MDTKRRVEIHERRTEVKKKEVTKEGKEEICEHAMNETERDGMGWDGMKRMPKKKKSSPTSHNPTSEFTFIGVLGSFFDSLHHCLL